MLVRVHTVQRTNGTEKLNSLGDTCRDLLVLGLIKEAAHTQKQLEEYHKGMFGLKCLVVHIVEQPQTGDFLPSCTE